ncbi:MAG: hypothetical protein CSA32_04125 [Desulfobulbus propionicus]|nr:MAG: hypothetical protein CSA32_04125 [Desulfobulbus propionicus]
MPRAHLITPVSSGTSLPVTLSPDTLSVTCDDFCEIPMIRRGLTDEGHEYKGGAKPGQCPRALQCPGYRIIAFTTGHLQRMPIDCEEAKQAVDIR